MDDFKSQRRGGKGVIAIKFKEKVYVVHFFPFLFLPLTFFRSFRLEAEVQLRGKRASNQQVSIASLVLLLVYSLTIAISVYCTYTCTHTQMLCAVCACVRLEMS